MRMTRTLLVVALLLLPLDMQAQPQGSSAGSLKPDAASSQSQGADVLWYGKAPPGWGGVVSDMKLLAPGIGWANRGGRCYWTTDNGANWTDFTPPESPDVQADAGAGSLYNLFFLDTHRGWALVSGCGTDNPKKLDVELDLLSTSDSGATWSKIPVTSIALSNYGNPDGVSIVGCGANFAFSDSLHGWMNITVSGETMNTFGGILLVTSDGGKTWNRTTKDPKLAFAEMLLPTSSDGWLFGAETDSELHGDSNDRQLYVTRDATESWQKVTLTAPKEIAPADCSVHSLPIFEDTKHGFLQGNCLTNKDGENKSAIALFETEDDGRTWKPDRIVKNVEGSSRTKYRLSTLSGSNWIFAAVSNHHPVLTQLGPGARIDATVEAATSSTRYAAARQVSFVTPTQGWVIVGDGELLSTTDGGATWTNISSGPKPHVIHPLYGP
jgi:photosystem II stability/assembly factor-like uncharacterized protein